MPSGPTNLSLMAAGLYVFVFLLAGLSAMTATGPKQSSWHLRGWLGVAILFAALIAMRLLDLENFVRDELRAMLIDGASYGARRDYQRLIVASILALASLLGFSLLYGAARGRRGRRDIAVMVAIAASMGMIVLMAFRLISLHATDALLYGPLKLNWVGDIGLSLAVAAAALYYIRLVRAKPDARLR